MKEALRPAVPRARQVRGASVTDGLLDVAADALFDLAWDAVKAGVRMRHPDFDITAVHHAARALFRRAAN